MNRIFLTIARLTFGLLSLTTAILRYFAEDMEESGDPYGSKKPGEFMFGEYNFRTHNLDDGTDPDGWYEEDM